MLTKSITVVYNPEGGVGMEIGAGISLVLAEMMLGVALASVQRRLTVEAVAQQLKTGVVLGTSMPGGR